MEGRRGRTEFLGMGELKVRDADDPIEGPGKGQGKK